MADHPDVTLNLEGGYSPPSGESVSLDFAQHAAPPGPLDDVDLLITAVLPAPRLRATLVPSAQLTIDATLPPPQLCATLGPEIEVTVTATLSAPQLHTRLNYNINVYRDPSRLASSRWKGTGRQHVATANGYQQGITTRRQATARYQQAPSQHRRHAATSRHLPRTDVRRAVVQEQGDPLRLGLSAINAYLPRLDQRKGERAAQGDPLDMASVVRNIYLPHLRTHWGLPFEQASDILARHWGDTWRHGADRTFGVDALYEQAKWPPPGISLPPAPPVPPEPAPPFTPTTDLDFCARQPVNTDLDFAVDPCAPRESIIVPIQRTYLVSNSASLTLVATGQALDATAISVAIDTDSWAWELRATVIGDDSIALVRDAARPTELEATINGHTWRVVLDDWRRDQRWSQMPAVTVSARSLAAYLGAPHATPRSHTESEARTAQQLAEQELPVGWSLDWEIDDWLVPAEAWRYIERTPIEAITAIATAAGAVVQAHPSEPRLIVAPRYRVPHWAWQNETPDVTLPLDVLTRLGSDYRPTEASNAVYVAGETTGVLALVRRTGTAGDRLAPMIVDPLTTEPAPARGRGIATLSATGEQTRETLVLPLADSLASLLSTGQLLRVDPDGDDWRGMVRAVSIDARLQGSGSRAALVVDQTAELERHLEETA